MKSVKVATIPEECHRFNECSAQLCPLDNELEKRIWYPKEEICRVVGSSDLLWIENQKKIQKVSNSETGYFTLEMLDRPMTVKSGIKGIDPDKDREQQIQKWLLDHPDRSKDEPSQKQIESRKKAAERLVKYRKERLRDKPLEDNQESAPKIT